LSAIMIAILKSPKKVNIYNLGTNQFSTVSNSVNQITKRLSLKPKINYKGGKRGWPGDVPTIYLNTRKIRKLGWKPKHTINESIVETLEFLIKNKWLLKKN